MLGATEYWYWYWYGDTPTLEMGLWSLLIRSGTGGYGDLRRLAPRHMLVPEARGNS